MAGRASAPSRVWVWLSVEESAAGECAQASVLRSSGVSALDQAALAAVRRRWRFVPARQGQTPVESKWKSPFASNSAMRARRNKGA